MSQYAKSVCVTAVVLLATKSGHVGANVAKRDQDPNLRGLMMKTPDQTNDAALKVSISKVKGEDAELLKPSEQTKERDMTAKDDFETFLESPSPDNDGDDDDDEEDGNPSAPAVASARGTTNDDDEDEKYKDEKHDAQVLDSLKQTEDLEKKLEGASAPVESSGTAAREGDPDHKEDEEDELSKDFSLSASNGDITIKKDNVVQCHGTLTPGVETTTYTKDGESTNCKSSDCTNVCKADGVCGGQDSLPARAGSSCSNDCSACYQGCCKPVHWTSGERVSSGGHCGVAITWNHCQRFYR